MQTIDSSRNTRATRSVTVHVTILGVVTAVIEKFVPDAGVHEIVGANPELSFAVGAKVTMVPDTRAGGVTDMFAGHEIVGAARGMQACELVAVLLAVSSVVDEQAVQTVQSVRLLVTQLATKQKKYVDPFTTRGVMV